MMKFCSSKIASNKKVEDQVPSDDKFQEIYELHSCSSSEVQDENRTTSPEFSTLLQDGESETDSLKNNSFGIRSKRARKTRVFCSEMVKKLPKFGETNEEQSPLSSISDTTTEEDLAHCLMMLSKDKWEREDDDSEDSGDVVKVNKNAKVRGKYRCETCNKLFKSYQALGGHRASYKKIKADVAARQPRDGGGRAAAEEKVHKCPFCHRVFASGQALGGHKRSHFMGAPNVTLTTVSRNVENFDIDLNLPAPVDDDDEIDLSLQ